MLLSCRFYIVGLQLLLLTHVAHSFVLITANVDDVKKIARKFVSDSLAEKIADFIARATETLAQNKISEENESNADDQESSQVSAENRMYNGAEGKSKEEIGLRKVPVKAPKKTFGEKKKHGLEDPGTTRKPKKAPKPLHSRSRYIIQTENKASLATEKALTKISEEDKYNKMKESIQLLEDKMFSTADGKRKSNKQKKMVKGRAYKLLSSYASVENDAANGGIPDSKEKKDEERFFSVRARGEDRLPSLPTEEAVTGVDQLEIEGDTNTETAHTREPLDLTEKDEFDHDENKIIEKTEMAPPSGSRSFVGETDVKEENWWEKELPAHAHGVNSQGKSWF